MRSRLTILVFIFLLAPSIYQACSKEDYLPGLTGSLVGYLYTFDELGNLLDDHSQVKITAIGMGESFTANSDYNGRFELKDVPTGTYELHFEKSGFGVLKQFGVQHLGGKPTILPFISSYEHAYFLYEIPTTTIDNLSIVGDSISAEFSFTVPIPPDRIRIRIYLSSSANFSGEMAEYSFSIVLWKANGHYIYSKLYSLDGLYNPGALVYYKASCLNLVGLFQPPMQNYRTIYGVDEYYDYVNDKIIYPGLGDESEEYRFIFPE